MPAMPDPSAARDSFAAAWRTAADADELAAMSPEGVDATIEAHFELARRRAPGEHRVHAALAGSGAGTRLQVVTDDAPWLVASLHALLRGRDRPVRRLLHPVLHVRRDADGELEAASAHASEGHVAESFMSVEIEPIARERLPALERAVRDMLEVLDVVREAGPALDERVGGLAGSVDDVEQAAFLHWLHGERFAPFGAARATLDADGHLAGLDDALGLLGDGAGRHRWAAEDLLPARLDTRHIDDDVDVVVCKASRTAPLIRGEETDLLLVVRRDGDGRVNGLDAIIGLFVPGLQNEAVDAIPWLRERVRRVREASGTRPDSHDGRTLAATLRSLPREMLLQTRRAPLLEMARAIVALQERRQTRTFGSVDPLGRTWHCLVFLPSEVYTRALRLEVERTLERGLDGHSTGFESRFTSASPLARLHFVVRRRRTGPDPDWAAIRATVEAATVSWDDRLEALLFDPPGAAGGAGTDAPGDAGDAGGATNGAAGAPALPGRWRNAFPSSYREEFDALDAARDIDIVERELGPGRPAMGPLEPGTEPGTFTFRLYSPGAAMSLSDAIPLVENLGLAVVAEHPYALTPDAAEPVHVHLFTVRAPDLAGAAPDAAVPEDGSAPDASASPADEGSRRLRATFDAIWAGRVENDGFNRLVHAAGLDHRQVNVLRALGKYLVQARAPFSIAYTIDTLVRQAPIARALVELFEARLRPLDAPGGADDGRSGGESGGADPDARADELAARVERALDGVASLDEDRILRRLLGTVNAVLRTNHWRTGADGSPLDYLSMKLDSLRVPGLPLPRPHVEIFVASARVDGVHLRGGPVARGGLRWSDRREDFRTEVLGLMKAQMVKNAVIVPVGSKGGFVVKAALPAERDAAMQIVVECYRTFLRGLLDLTDDLDGSTVVPPPDVRRRDGDDPYLVVAADKGTATFSDHANAVAAEYGFWLGDAFASGGSVGYDHKAMGITARGAWESVKRHFRTLGVDCQTDDFTVAGIGDMSGDVFGNGMLLSTHIRLVAAFDHRHVFIDPDPDAARTHAERARLFALPRSSWADYDASLISTGGGVWARTEKSIPVSAEARAALGIDVERATPDELISAILTAPVDLLWNGGIGTYVKGSTETDAQAADRANDAVRVDGRELRARVVGEGGNLGFTQLARIEFARTGGLIYTDAIDNAAGVDCSDHEVNIKILVDSALASGALAADEREALLASMTDEVGTLVLKDNYLQTQCIDLHHAEGVDALSGQARLMEHLEGIGRLDRGLEYLPDAEGLAERLADGLALTRPEIAVLVSYAKMTLYDEVLASDLPDDPRHAPLLEGYFPTTLRERFPDEVAGHRLAREIVATLATNEAVNRLGPTFVARMREVHGVGGARVVDAFLAVRRVFRLDARWAEIEALDARVDEAVRLRLMALVRGLAERSVNWLLVTLRDRAPTIEEIERWEQGVDELGAALPGCLSSSPTRTLEERRRHFANAGVPADVAASVAGVVPMSSALDIVGIAHAAGESVADASGLYFALGERLDLHWLRDRIGELGGGSRLHERARAELRADLHYQHRHLAAEIAAATPPGGGADERVDAWTSIGGTVRVERYLALLADIRSAGGTDFTTLSLAVDELHKLLRAARPLGAGADGAPATVQPERRAAEGDRRA